MSNVLAAGECDDGTEYVLPPHQRCASHTLNLVAVHDNENALSDAGYKRVCRATMAEYSGLWNKASRSTQCADVVSEKLQPSLVVPNDTRWNSHFRAMEKIKHILEKNPDDTVQEVFTALEVPQLRENEVAFIKEYCCVMQLLAFALDVLQAENKCYIGFLLPTITCLGSKLRARKPSVKVSKCGFV